MPFAHRLIAAAAGATTALALAVAGCGSADDASLQTVPSTPAGTTTVPAGPPAAPAPASTRPAPPAASPSGSGGSQAPDNSGGTPIQRSPRDFERYCDTHPRACED
jgi:hypothetical protein